jgi:rod shape-determining protein MreD
MQSKLIRLGIIFLAILIQISFLPVLFSANEVPNIILLLVISWAVIMGFDNILIWAIIIGVAADLIFFRAVGTSVIFFIVIAYSISFVSRRFLVENKNLGFLIIAFFIVFSTIFYGFLNIFINSRLIENFRGSFGTQLILLQKSILIQIAFNLLLFPLCYFPLVRLEKYLSFYEKKISLK